MKIFKMAEFQGGECIINNTRGGIAIRQKKECRYWEEHSSPGCVFMFPLVRSFNFISQCEHDFISGT
jgi:hypothetical protein